MEPTNLCRYLSQWQPRYQKGHVHSPVVRKSPGHTQLHLIPCWMKSAATDFVRPITAALVVL